MDEYIKEIIERLEAAGLDVNVREAFEAISTHRQYSAFHDAYGDGMTRAKDVVHDEVPYDVAVMLAVYTVKAALHEDPDRYGRAKKTLGEFEDVLVALAQMGAMAGYAIAMEKANESTDASVILQN